MLMSSLDHLISLPVYLVYENIVIVGLLYFLERKSFVVHVRETRTDYVFSIDDVKSVEGNTIFLTKEATILP